MIKEGRFSVIVGLVILLICSAVLATTGTIWIAKNPAILLVKMGNHYAQLKEYDKSIAAYNEALKIDEHNVEARHNEGVVYHDQGEMNLAIDAFEKAIKMDSGYFKAYYSLGLLYFELKSYTQSIEQLGQAAALEPNNTNIHFDLGVAFVERFRQKESSGEVSSDDLDDLQRGINQYEQVIVLDPSYSHASENLQIVKGVLEWYKETG